MLFSTLSSQNFTTFGSANYRKLENVTGLQLLGNKSHAESRIKSHSNRQMH